MPRKWFVEDWRFLFHCCTCFIYTVYIFNQLAFQLTCLNGDDDEFAPSLFKIKDASFEHITRRISALKYLKTTTPLLCILLCCVVVLS